MTRSVRGALAAALGVFIVASLIRRGGAVDFASIEPGVRVSQMFVERTIWAVLGIAVVSHQYLARTTRRSLGLAAATVIIGLPLIRQLPVDFTPPEVIEATPHVTSTEWPHADDLEPYLVNLRVDQHRGSAGPGMRDGIAATIAFEGGSGALLSVASSRSRVIGVGAGEVLTPTLPPEDVNLARLGWRFVRPSIEGMTLAANRRPTSTQTRAWIAVEDPDDAAGTLDRVREGNRLELELDFDAFEPVVVAVLDTRVGARTSVPDRGDLVVHAVESSGRTVRVEVGHRWRPIHLLRPRSPAPLRDDISFALRSRRYNEFIMDTGSGGNGRSYSLTGGATLHEPSRWLEFEARFAEGRSGSRLPEDWFEDVELVVLTAEYAGSFTKSITREIEEWPTGQLPKVVDGYPGS